MIHVVVYVQQHLETRLAKLRIFPAVVDAEELTLQRPGGHKVDHVGLCWAFAPSEPLWFP